MNNIDPSKLPAHIAIIMDGNGRWARKRGLPRIFGHRKSMSNVREIVEECSRLGIKALTLYAFSTENWIRPKKEVAGLMSILKTYLRKETDRLNKNNVRLRHTGDASRLPEPQRQELEKAIKATSGNTGLVLNLALNYGSRQEILRAVNVLLKKGLRAADEKAFSEQLYTAGLPDPDLLIRTSGEMRLSNFLLWQLAYTELFVTPVLWPDFKTKDLHEAIIDYQQRERRYGGI